MAPERVLVFEVRGTLSAFAAAVQNVRGLELIDEEELVGDDEDKAPVAYLMVPDVRALREIESLYRRWEAGELVYGEGAWADVFDRLRNLRPWGPMDRVDGPDREYLIEEIEGRDDAELVKIEIEVVFRENDGQARGQEEEVLAAVTASGGRLLSRSRIADIAYHAVLVEIPVVAVRGIIEHRGIAGLDPVMHVRPQSVATTIEINDTGEPIEAPQQQAELGEPILALLDGVPVAAHPLLNRHLIVDDQFGLEPNTPVADRNHGTAMSSIIVHGDRNLPGRPLPRRIHVVPVLGAGDNFPQERLVVDLIYTAVLAMRGGAQPSARNVLIVNLSLGNKRRSFHGSLSPWARLLDRLAYQYGILFVVSAGNNIESFQLPPFPTRAAFEDAGGADRSRATIQTIGNIIAQRRLFAPAETVNGVTVGACNIDAVTDADRRAARVNVDPYPDHAMPNPSSTLGPGFGGSVKPDILMPGAREHLRVINNNAHIEVVPAPGSRSAGLKVAAPPRGGREGVDGYTSGTSPAAALASRTSHRIHDALEAVYGDAFRALPSTQRAVLLKALLVHPAAWPAEAAALIKEMTCPPGTHHVRVKDSIRRFLGYGLVDAEDAVACAEDRATFWAIGTLEAKKAAVIPIPVPQVYAQTRPHSLAATLAWFTPVRPGRKSYRSVRLKIMDPAELARLRLDAHPNQPDANQTARGTVFTRCWTGLKTPAVQPDMTISLAVQREPDQGPPVDEAVPFGLAVTLAMPGAVQLYEQVRQQLTIINQLPAR